MFGTARSDQDLIGTGDAGADVTEIIDQLELREYPAAERDLLAQRADRGRFEVDGSGHEEPLRLCRFPAL